MHLTARLRDYWRDLKRGRPGHRFRDRYERSAETRSRQHVAWRIGKVVLGAFAVGIGVVELLLPGPAILFFVVGGALLATESRAIARAMDWAESRGRVTLRWIGRKVGFRRHPGAMVILATGTAVLARVAADPALGG